MRIVHRQGAPKRQLKRQKRVIAPDYPFYIVSLYKCLCGCNGYYVTLDKIDIGYQKKMYDIEFNTPLEAFLKFEKMVDEAQMGKYDMVRPLEGESFM